MLYDQEKRVRVDFYNLVAISIMKIFVFFSDLINLSFFTCSPFSKVIEFIAHSSLFLPFNELDKLRNSKF